MDTTKDTTMQHVTDAVIAEIKRAAEHPLQAPVIVRADTMLGVLARIEQLESDLATAEQDSRQKQARIERLEEEESKQAALLDCLNEWKELAKSAEKERDALRAKVEALEKQEPFDANSDVFRGAFEAALKAGNWPMTRQGDGYRSPSTQIAWRIAFSTVNRMKLYLAPGAKGEEK